MVWGQGGASGGEGRMRSDGAAEGWGGAGRGEAGRGASQQRERWCEGQSRMKGRSGPSARKGP